MKSYASVDRVEGNFVVCELEMLEVENSKPEDCDVKETAMVDISLSEVLSSVGDVYCGDILIIEHEGESVINICEKDFEEADRRTEYLKQLSAKW